MAGDFDPYHKWLGIPPAEQPPNHYRLLGISKFENDPDVIQIAADRQMAHLRSLSGGPNAAAAERILNETAAAKLCLLNDTKRIEYERQLHEQERAAVPEPAPVQQLPPVEPLRTVTPLSAAMPQAAQLPPGSQYPASQTPGPQVRPVPVSSAARPIADAGGFQSIGRAAPQRRTRKKKKTVNLVGHIVAPLAGLVVGYVVLCAVGPEYDFLGLVHRQAPQQEEGVANRPADDESTERTRIAVKSHNPPPKRIDLRSTPNSKQQDGSQGDESRTPPGPSRSEPTIPQRPSKPALPANPLQQVGKYAALPPLEQSEAYKLFPVYCRDDQHCELTLIAAGSEEEPAEISLQQPESDKEQWQVVRKQGADGSSAATEEQAVVAEFTRDGNSLKFRWTTAAFKLGEDARRLRESFLRLQVAEHEKLVQLSEPRFLPPVKIELEKKVDLTPISLPEGVSPDGLQFEITRLHPFKPRYQFKGRRQRCAFGETLTIDLPNVEGAQLELSTVDRGEGPSLALSAEYRLPGHPQPFELTLDRVNAQAAAFQKALDAARTAIPNLQSQGTTLQSQLRAVSATSVPSGPAGAAAQVAKARRMSALQTQIKRVAKKYQSAQETVPEMQRNLRNLEIVGNLGNALRGGTPEERAQIHFRLCRPVTYDGKEYQLVVAESKAGLVSESTATDAAASATN